MALSRRLRSLLATTGPGSDPLSAVQTGEHLRSLLTNEMMDGLLSQASKGHGGCVVIEGEPGIGKTSLVRAVAAKAIERGCQVFWGGGDELSQALPLLPFIDGLRVRDPSASLRRNTIVRLLRGEFAADRGADVPAVLAE